MGKRFACFAGSCFWPCQKCDPAYIHPMGLRFSAHMSGACFFVTTTFNRWREYGRLEGVYDALIDSIKHYLTKYGARMPAYVLMPTHLHLLLIIEGDRLSGFMRDFKKYLAQKAIRELGIRDLPIWRPGYDRQVIYSETVFRTKVTYIHENPVRYGLVERAEQWVWSSAGDYFSDKPGPMPVWKEWMF